MGEGGQYLEQPCSLPSLRRSTARGRAAYALINTESALPSDGGWRGRGGEDKGRPDGGHCRSPRAKGTAVVPARNVQNKAANWATS